LKPVHCNVISYKNGRSTGDGKAWFKTLDEAQEALKLDRQEMNSRYIELFHDNPPKRIGKNSNNLEKDSDFGSIESGNDNSGKDMSDSGGDNFGSIGSGNDNSGNDKSDLFCIYLRGMPYSCNEMDILKFFSPYKPVHCNVIYENGRPSGEGKAWFKTYDEAKEALKLDRQEMGSRYIELFQVNSRIRKTRKRYGF